MHRTPGRPPPPAFKGVGLPTFAFGTMVWAVAAAVDAGPGVNHRPGADEVLGWVSTRPDWIPNVTPPQSLAERFRAAINVEIVISSRYVTPARLLRVRLRRGQRHRSVAQND